MKLISAKLFLALIVICVFSCKEKDDWKTEVIMMLDQQNKIESDAITRMEGSLYEMIYDSYYGNRYEYLEPTIKSFFESVKRFSSSVSSTILSPNKDSLTYLFDKYQRVQYAYKILQQKILDSIPNIKIHESAKNFINFDRSTFTKKYLSSNDSINSKLRLLCLQADANNCEYIFIDCILASTTFNSRVIDWKIPIANTDKPSYLKGEKMELTTAFATFKTAKIRYAIIDGHRIETPSGFLRYSRKADEKPGIHKLSFKVFIKEHGAIEYYPVAVSYHVQK